MKNLPIISGFLAILFAHACKSVPAPDPAAVFLLTKAANDASLRGHIEKNAAMIAAVYARDAVILPPGGAAPVSGLEAIRAHYETAMKGPGSSLKIDTENIRFEVIDQDNATELGRYSILYRAAPNAEPTLIKGEMLIIWKREDGQWKIRYDMWH